MLIADIITGKCPHCRQGPIFQSLMRMHPYCTNCGIKYEREEGYYSMSMFVGYVIAAVWALPFVLIAYLLGWRMTGFVVLPSLAIILVIPWIFRYARIVWMYIDELIDPRREDELGALWRDQTE